MRRIGDKDEFFIPRPRGFYGIAKFRARFDKRLMDATGSEIRERGVERTILQYFKPEIGLARDPVRGRRTSARTQNCEDSILTPMIRDVADGQKRPVR
jgi:hypothetical protein